GRGQPGPERDEELEPAGFPGQRGGDQPCVLAPGARRGEHRRETELLRGAGHLGEVLDVRWPFLRGGAADMRGVRPPRRGQAVPPAHDRPAVAGGRQEPVERQGHELGPPTVLLNAVTTNFLKSTCPGIRPAAVNASDTCCSEVMTAGVIGTASAESSAVAL